ncbi:hypothetical protein B5S33_g3321 [[Candida] boidinii]|nr:hypothetical protein B5S33_g3321 [[Candida] boidinii]
MSRVEILEFKDYKKAARTLYEAFEGDDVKRYATRFLENDPVAKKNLDMALFESYVYSHLMIGKCFVIKGDDHETKDTFETVALFTTPDSPELNYLSLIKSGFAKVAWMAGSEGRRRIFKVLFAVLHDNFFKIMGPDLNRVWTLVYLASTKQARGKGNVRAMFDYVFTNYIDKDNCLTYLESSNYVNTPIYERFQFAPAADIWLGDLEHKDDKARMDVMIRGVQGKPYERLEEIRKEYNYVIPDNSKEYTGN